MIERRWLKIIGLLDYDLLISKKNSVIIPNLEIMKLATYYRSEENQFCRLVSLKEQNLDNYDQIYFFSESRKKPIVPPQFLQQNNIIYGGTAFTKNYVPFKNELIDFTIPRTIIYKDFLKQKYHDGVRASVINHALDDSYYRMYAGDSKLPIPPIHTNKRTYIYDKNFFNPQWEKIIEEIINRRSKSIICLHPIRCTNLIQYFNLRAHQQISRSNTIILDLSIPLDEIQIMLKKYKNLFLADIVKSSNIYIPIGGSYSTNIQYFRDYIFKLNLLFSFWSCGIMVKIKYEEPDIGFNNPITNLSLLTENIFNLSTKKKMETTLQEKIDVKRKHNLYSEEQELLLKFFPTAKDLFKQSFNDIKERRMWRI